MRRILLLAAVLAVLPAQARDVTLEPVLEKLQRDGYDDTLGWTVSQYLGLLPAGEEVKLPIRALDWQEAGTLRGFGISKRDETAIVMVFQTDTEFVAYRTDVKGRLIRGGKWQRPNGSVTELASTEHFEAEKRFWLARAGRN